MKIPPSLKRVVEIMMEKEGRTKKGGTANVFDDNDLLLYAPRGDEVQLAIPCALIPGVLALTYYPYRHAGVARTAVVLVEKR